MIQLIEKSTGRRFDLPKDVSISISLQNPFFGDSATFTLPVELPLTDNNRTILNNSNLFASNAHSQKEVDSVLICGALQYDGKLTVLSYSNTTAEVSFVSNYADLCTMLGDATLADVMGDDYEQYASIQAMLSHFNTQSMESIDVDITTSSVKHKYAIFPALFGDLVVNNYWKDLVSGYQGNLPSDNVNDMCILHESYTAGWDQTIEIETEAGASITALAHYIKDSQEREIKVCGGYTVAPFLYAWFVLKKICEYAGLPLADTDNVMFTNEAFRHSVIMHNTIDACCDWVNYRLYYKNLVPDVKASDFIKDIQTIFGVSVIANANTSKTVWWNDVFTLYSGTVQKLSKPSAEYSVELASKKNLIYNYSGCTLDGINAVIYMKSFGSSSFVSSLVNMVDCGGNGHGYMTGAIKVEGLLKKRYDVCHRDAYASIPPSADESDSSDLSASTPTFAGYVQMFGARNGLAPLYSLPVLAGYKNKVVNVEYNGEDITADEDCPLMFLFHLERRSPSYSNISEYYQAEGSAEISVYTNEFPNTYVRYNILDLQDLNVVLQSFKRQGMSLSTIRAHLSGFDLASFNFGSLVLYDNCLCLVKEINYELADVSDIEVEIKMYKLPSCFWILLS